MSRKLRGRPLPHVAFMVIVFVTPVITLLSIIVALLVAATLPLVTLAVAVMGLCAYVLVSATV